MEKKVMVMNSDDVVDDKDVERVDMADLPPERRFELMLLFLAQNLEGAGMEDEFILICRDKKRQSWGTHTTIRDQDAMYRLLGKMAQRQGVSSEYERVVSIDNFTKKTN